MKEFISSLGVIPSASGPMKIFFDNTGAIAIAKEPGFTRRPSTSNAASTPSAITPRREK